MGVLCLVLAGIVMSRLETKTDVIFGGIDGAIVSTDSYVAAGADDVYELEAGDDGGDVDMVSHFGVLVPDEAALEVVGPAGVFVFPAVDL
jgi:hypothetical protein